MPRASPAPDTCSLSCLRSMGAGQVLKGLCRELKGETRYRRPGPQKLRNRCRNREALQTGLHSLGLRTRDLTAGESLACLGIPAHPDSQSQKTALRSTARSEKGVHSILKISCPEANDTTFKYGQQKPLLGGQLG